MSPKHGPVGAVSARHRATELVSSELIRHDKDGSRRSTDPSCWLLVAGCWLRTHRFLRDSLVPSSWQRRQEPQGQRGTWMRQHKYMYSVHTCNTCSGRVTRRQGSQGSQGQGGVRCLCCSCSHQIPPPTPSQQPPRTVIQSISPPPRKPTSHLTPVVDPYIHTYIHTFIIRNP